MTTTRFPDCDHPGCKLRIIGKPLKGQLAGKRIRMRAVHDLPIIGFGNKLRVRVHADWVKDTCLLDGVIYGFSRDFRVVKIQARSLKELEELLGSAFARVEQGILVACDACLVVEERMVGIEIDDVDGTRIIHYVSCSREGAKRLAACLSPLKPAA